MFQFALISHFLYYNIGLKSLLTHSGFSHPDLNHSVTLPKLSEQILLSI